MQAQTLRERLFEIARKVVMLEGQRDEIDRQIVALRSECDGLLPDDSATTIPRAAARRPPAKVTRQVAGRRRGHRTVMPKKVADAVRRGAKMTSEKGPSQRAQILAAVAAKDGPATMEDIVAALGVPTERERRVELTVYELSARRHEKLARVGPGLFEITPKGREWLAHAS
jgi:hypothetical protein